MRTRSASTLFTAIAIAVVLLAGCGGSSKKDTAATTSTSGGSGSGSTTSAAKGSAACDGLTAGKDGIIRVFCDGNATAKVAIGATTTNLTGGTCEESGGYYTINFGAVAGPDHTGAKPDYIGALFPDGGGAPQAVTVRVGGKAGLVTGATGDVSADKQSVHLAGTSTDGAVSVDIGC